MNTEMTLHNSQPTPGEEGFSTRRRSPRAVLAHSCLLSLISFFLSGACSPCGDCPEVGGEDAPETITRLRAVPSGVSVITRAGNTESLLPQARVSTGIRRLDVFVFDDDDAGRLDSWHSFEPASSGTLSVSSRSGEKIAVVVANMNPDAFSRGATSCFESFCHIRSELQDDNPDYPVMSGQAAFVAGADETLSVTLEPLMSRILLSSVCVDFSGKPYASSQLTNASAYLINVNSSCEIMKRSGFVPESILNNGALDTRDLESVLRPSMLYRRLGNIGRVRNYYMNDFVCYPNDISEEGLGQPFTRFVLQGDINGQTWYYPVNINQTGFGHSLGGYGIGRNVYHILDLTITRQGSSSPDDVLEPENVDVQGWIELHPGNIITGEDGETIHVWTEVFPEETIVDISIEDLEYDHSRGIYEYRMDPDGRGVWLTLTKGGTGMFTIDAGPPVNSGFLVIVVVNP